VFGSNPGFVFHDSCGFEAGGVDEFKKMKEFVLERAPLFLACALITIINTIASLASTTSAD